MATGVLSHFNSERERQGRENKVVATLSDDGEGEVKLGLRGN